MPIDYSQVTEAAYRKLKTAKTLDKFHAETYDGISVKAYDPGTFKEGIIKLL